MTLWVHQEQRGIKFVTKFVIFKWKVLMRIQMTSWVHRQQIGESKFVEFKWLLGCGGNKQDFGVESEHEPHFKIVTKFAICKWKVREIQMTPRVHRWQAGFWRWIWAWTTLQVSPTGGLLRFHCCGSWMYRSTVWRCLFRRGRERERERKKEKERDGEGERKRERRERRERERERECVCVCACACVFSKWTKVRMAIYIGLD